MSVENSHFPCALLCVSFIRRPLHFFGKSSTFIPMFDIGIRMNMNKNDINEFKEFKVAANMKREDFGVL